MVKDRPAPPRADGAAALLPALGARSLIRLFPDSQWAVRGSQDKVVVRREQRQPVTDAELREQCVDGADPNAVATESERPYAGIDEQRHLRERSAL